MFNPHSAAFGCLLLLLLNVCLSAGKKSTNIPSEAEWGSIEDIDTSGETKRYLQIVIVFGKYYYFGLCSLQSLDPSASIVDDMLSDMEMRIFESETMGRARKEMPSNGVIQAGHGPVVRHENVGGGANDTIDGGDYHKEGHSGKGSYLFYL